MHWEALRFLGSLCALLVLSCIFLAYVRWRLKRHRDLDEGYVFRGFRIHTLFGKNKDERDDGS